MTICASVKVRDGLVLGTDSMTQIWGEGDTGKLGIIKTYSNARKLFQIDELPVGVMTYGIGNLGSRSIQGLIREFSVDCPEECNVESLSQSLYDFFNKSYQEQFKDTPDPPLLGFYVAGYSKGKPFPEEWEFLLPRDTESHLVRPLDQFGASWRGIAIPFTRLYKGIDPRLLKELIDAGVPEELLSKYESPIVYDGMPVQDAINFVKFILQTTIGLANFEVGTPSCGRPLQIATVLPPDTVPGFRWIKEPVLT